MGINVLSLFDGISCGRVALERAGIKVDKYFASEVDKHAIKVSKDNWDDIIHIGDVTKVCYKDGVLYNEEGSVFEGKIDLVIGGSPCFVAGTIVLTQDGMKNIEDVSVGDVVLTHTNSWKPVLKTGGQTSRDTYDIKVQGILPTTTTAEHPYFIRSCKRQGKNNSKCFSEPGWKPVKDIVKGDYVGIPIIQEAENPLSITEEEAFILGRYIADGHTRKDYRTTENRPDDRHWQMILSIGSHKLEMFTGKIKQHFSCYEHTKSVHRVVFSSKRLVELAETHCGVGAENKHISPQLLKLPVHVLSKVLEGILSGDGSVRNGVYRVTTISKLLVNSIQLAVGKVYEEVGSVEMTKRPSTTVICGRTVNQKDTYTISFRKGVKKQSHFKKIGEHLWTPIKSVKCVGETIMVFNLEVADDNSYTANNAVVHNCQGFSMSGKQLAFDDPRSVLYFEYERIVKEILTENPSAKFLLENVRMNKKHSTVISERLGVLPIAINSALVSAQNRHRLYWTNIDDVEQPKDSGICLQDIIEFVVDEKYNLTDKARKYILDEERLRKKRVVINGGKSICLCARYLALNGTFLCIDANGKIAEDKTGALLSRYYKGVASFGGDPFVIGSQDSETFTLRKLTPIECERLQTLPDNYTKAVSNSQRYKALGNGWTVDVIAHIFKNIKEKHERERQEGDVQ